MKTSDTLITLQEAQHEQASEMIGRAFLNDPLFLSLPLHRPQ
jgi:hypothetical protein